MTKSALHVVESGPRAVERELLAAVEAELAAARTDPRLLARPVRVIVPSRSLAAHLGAILVRDRSSVAGVLVQTVRAAACEVLERGGIPVPGSGDPNLDDALVAILVRRAARREPTLARALAPIEDGFAAVVASVRDLLDAGLRSSDRAAVEEVLATPAWTEPRIEPRAEARIELRAEARIEKGERRAALVRVALRTAEEIEDRGLGGTAALYRAACERLSAAPAHALPARALFVHGFADATGVVADFLRALLERRSARIFLDHPPEPRPGSSPRCEDAFVRELERVLLLGERRIDATLPPPRPEVFRSMGATAEAREVARRIRRALDQGARPETIAVVARSLDGRAASLRTQLARLSIPFSGVDATAPLGRRAGLAHAFLELLAQGERASVDRWLDAARSLAAVDHPHGVALRAPFVDLRLAARELGAGRLADLAALDARSSIEEGEGPDAGVASRDPRIGLTPRIGLVRHPETGLVSARRRSVALAAIEELTGRARRWSSRLAALDVPQSARGMLAGLAALAADELGWSTSDDPTAPLIARLRALASRAPIGLTLDLDEARALAERVLSTAADEPIGGAGGGVQILDATEARGRTFERLFLIGLNRDAFPRSISEDPLFPDGNRQTLRGLLDALPIKARGYDEERYLFAQLLSSAEHVTVSWQSCDDEGKALAPSAFVEGLLDRPADELAATPPVHPCDAEHAWRRTDASATPRPAHEQAVLLALHGTRSDFGAALALALRESGSIRTEACAAARLRTIAELEITNGPKAGSNPWFGFVGRLEPGLRIDPREQPLHVTTLERVARCGWQTYLQRVLRLERPRDPLGPFPDLDGRLVGSTVHHVLQGIVERQTGVASVDLAEALASEGSEALFPSEAELGPLIDGAAVAVLREERVALPGFARALALAARSFFAAARADLATARAEGARLLGAEVHGVSVFDREASRGSRAVEIRFRADRVERRGERTLLTDFKTGKEISEAAKPETRRTHFLEGVRRGDLLQAVAYAQARGVGSAAGRYLFLGAEVAESARIALTTSEDVEARQAYEGAVARVLAAFEAGAFLPRFVEPERDVEPRHCETCPVAEACSRGDSGARLRMRAFTAAPLHDLDAAQRAWLGLWNLWVKSPATEARP